jgi:hypothetical protein
VNKRNVREVKKIEMLLRKGVKSKQAEIEKKNGTEHEDECIGDVDDVYDGAGSEVE